MKKLLLTSILGFFLLAGTGMTVHAEETKENKETTEAKACCSSANAEKTAEATCGSDTADKAKTAEEKSGCDSDSAAVQTSQEASKAGVCGGSSEVKATQVSNTIPGECRKLPSGVNNRAENR